MNVDLRGLAKDLNANAVDLIEQVLQKHTVVILDVVREQTHELQAEREKVRALREALSEISFQCSDDLSGRAKQYIDAALQATAQEEP